MRGLLAALIPLWTIGAASNAGAALIASGTWAGNGHTYDIYSFDDDNKSWLDADGSISAPSHLATLTSSAEDAFVVSILTGAGLTGEYWLGGFQPAGSTEPGGGWEWVTGEAWSYTNWGGGEPNDLGGEGYLATWSASGWQWNDEGNLGNITGYVVETPVPEPATLMLIGAGLAGLGFASRRKRRV